MSSTLPANARISTNPFVESKLNHLRDRSLGSSAVRATTAEIARILAVEATQNHKPDHGKIGLIVVLRSGLGMSDAFLSQFAPDTDVVVYHIGMFREKYSLQPVEYYNKLPNNNTDVKRVYVIDPLIATGGTATAVIEALRDWGVEHITFVSMLTSQQGLEHAAKAWPEGTEFVIGAIDPRLDSNGYIEPGIGDIGDRLFGTGLSH
ncbi:uracil phosphoribosyltransferase [Talaromyces stipitatus ATCC 10500]|uniref:uracil phosphoribosyltransferase n=1 Tax=Talaromyces stipitatus (strain ATCC 10500 / CBS 375.48 / QM 6759 / NRRL 1006) TaxID=441959 RepID=B8M5E7_TALSN|nr:uracil phosphoribosyltransferase [Talaromyces stipitatus ATCC 10500]XP_002480188.1 uracil phosphoribosyltransferase [Talaromyces stipitatus ATCC 10500]XP_002480189.1 uracil phosphoribosyltransferase [Talaromyces stipitatus ATCC 10500]EED19753.1 uracil phosphoribosyltransferase [Talaromyces stipitatus ATCC 10500]EED19754.1 uracil phosphoribosyltransferase [Talaromyces stipitatus ATCC 10500]EED19755.1 uracil phosphoribosyltransferase [Talaromyces stipitatus ATCC 10500]